ncbi:expressed unknown protein [Seminavis robusta]|uniref:Uncharacterized protein n=1 Tax=Seminavis robusta TaxID=568900 RepID=A0A9N8H4F5_9STRA|nr:expressed unknown protein [Seminavis robusta]|eukprot:Sro112_g055870.1 n/a (559) ;mRNA; r:109769-111445
MTSKAVTTVDENGEKEKYIVSSQDEFLHLFEKLVLKDEDGYRIGGYLSLKDGQTYYVASVPAEYPPLSPAALRGPMITPRFPPSPPRDGITNAPFTLFRHEFVTRVLDFAKKTVILRSPPATGKTSLIDLTEKKLRETTEARVIRINVGECVDDQGLIDMLVEELGVRCNKIGSLLGDTWVLIDDAQLAFDAQRFWKIVVKDFSRIDSVNVVIAATYDLQSQGTTPYSFGEQTHISDLLLSPEEAEELYDGYVKQIPYARDWVAFKDTLLRLAGGHVGVLSGGVAMLYRIEKEEQKRLTQSEALAALRDSRFRVNLNRCFPCKKLMNEKQRMAVSERIISKGHMLNPIDASQGSQHDESLVQLVRAGVLSSTGAFSCLVAQWLYFNSFYNRPAEGPTSIGELILQAVRSLSALRLRQSCGTQHFPQEAAFQQLFNEAFTRLLPPAVSVCPELNTFAKDKNGRVLSGELDFYIGEDRCWAIELLRNGDKINEHVGRFDPQSGKYRGVGYKDYLVVDCRGALVREVATMQDRCTIYFSDNFQSAQCKMREDPLVTIDLSD